MRSIDSLLAAKYRQSAFLLEDEEDGGDDDDVLHLSNHLWYDVDGDGEDDGAVVLRGDAVQRLKVSQLKIQRWNLCTFGFAWKPHHYHLHDLVNLKPEEPLGCQW